jgi:hypothetical protein
MPATPKATLTPWIALLLGGGAASAVAQTAPPVAADADGGGLEEIVVTATKTEKKLQDVPMSITAFSAADIERNDFNSVQDWGNRLPNLTFQADDQRRTDLQTSVQIRGVSGAGFFARASQELAALPIVGDIRGKGFFMGIELVADPQTQQPFPVARQASRKLADIAFAKGLIIGANHGGIDGVLGDHVTLAPPYTCTLKDLHEIIAILKDSILEFQASLQ